MTRAVPKALIKFALFAGAADSATAGLACAAEDGTAITTNDIIIGCIEMAQTTNVITDRTSAAAIIAGGKITVTASANDVIACWWLARDAGLQVASPFIASEVGAGTTADTNITITGISTTDVIISAVSVNTTTGAWTDQTNDTTITAANTVQCGNDTSSTTVVVLWMDLSGPRSFSSLNLQFAVGTIDSSPSTDPSSATLTGINDEDIVLSVVCVDETDYDVLDDLTSVTTVASDDTLTVDEPSPTATAGAKLLVFYQKTNDLAA
jgi:hypothetical protein